MIGQIVPCENTKSGKPLRLIPITPEHLPVFRAGFEDFAISKYLLANNHCFTEAQEEEWFTKTANDPGKLAWSIECDGDVIGNAILTSINYRLRTATCGMTICKKEYWKDGIATRVMYARAKLAFEQLGLTRLFTAAFESNQGSIKASQKVGYEPYGVMPQANFIDGEFVAEVLQTLTPENLKNPGNPLRPPP